MKLLVIGSGMYVSGRNNTGHGTILAAIAQYARTSTLQLTVYSRRASGRQDIQAAIDRINAYLDSNLGFDYYSSEDCDLRDLLKSGQFDAVIVSVPDHLHFQFCELTLHAKIPTLVVKPFTATLDEAITLRDLAAKMGVYAAVEFHKRWDESNLLAKSRLDQKAIGDLSYIQVDYSQRITIPTKVFEGWADKTNIFQYLGVHYADLVYFLTDALPERVMAYGTRGILESMGLRTYDSIHVAMIWKYRQGGQFYVHYNTNWIDAERSSAMSDQKLKIVGTKGRIELDQKNRGFEIVTGEGGVQQSNPYFAEFLPDEDGANFFNGYGCKSIMTFISDVEKLKSGKSKLELLNKNRPSFNNSIVSSAIVEKVNESLKNNSQWIAFDEKIWNTTWTQ